MRLCARRQVVCLVFVLSISAVPVRAQAPPSCDKEAAEKEVVKVEKSRAGGNLEAALLHMERAFALCGDHRHLYNQAKFLLEMKRYPEAAVRYQKFLDKCQDQQDANLRKQAEEERDDLLRTPTLANVRGKFPDLSKGPAKQRRLVTVKIPRQPDKDAGNERKPPTAGTGQQPNPKGLPPDDRGPQPKPTETTDLQRPRDIEPQPKTDEREGDATARQPKTTETTERQQPRDAGAPKLTETQSVGTGSQPKATERQQPRDTGQLGPQPETARLQVNDTAQQPTTRPIYRRPWFWVTTALGGIAVSGIVVGVVLGTRPDRGPVLRPFDP